MDETHRKPHWRSEYIDSDEYKSLENPLPKPSVLVSCSNRFKIVYNIRLLYENTVCLFRQCLSKSGG